MNKRFARLAFAGLTLVLGILAGAAIPQQKSAGPTPPAVSPRVSAEISEFYADCSFVSAYSTRAERQRLMAYLADKDAPKDLASPRLGRVSKIMKKIKGKIAVDDPQMVVPAGPLDPSLLPQGLFVVQGIEPDSDKEIRVRLKAYDLEPAAVERLIQSYEAGRAPKDRPPSIAEETFPAGSLVSERNEVHTWRLVNDEWKECGEHAVLIKD